MSVKEKCSKLVAAVEKTGKLSPPLKRSFLSCQSMAELEQVNAPFKTGSKASLAERARKLGLETLAVGLLEGREQVRILHLLRLLLLLMSLLLLLLLLQGMGPGQRGAGGCGGQS